MHLRVVLGATLSPVFPSPDYLVPTAHEAFDENGKLQNEMAKARLQRYMQFFIEWAARVARLRADWR